MLKENVKYETLFWGILENIRYHKVLGLPGTTHILQAGSTQGSEASLEPSNPGERSL